MEKTYTIFGDSIAKGIVLQDDKILLAHKNTIQYIEEYYNVKINNQSKYGLSLKRLLEKNVIENYISNLDNSKQNFVFFCLGGNDADFDWKAVGDTPDLEHTMRTPLKEFSRLLNETINKLQSHNVKVILSTIMPIHSQLYFDNVISKIANSENVKEFLQNDLTNIHRVQECYNNEIVKTALKNNCLLLDVRTPMMMTKDYIKYFCEDGIHPNENGYKYLSQLYIKEIDDMKQDLMLNTTTTTHNTTNNENTEMQKIFSFSLPIKENLTNNSLQTNANMHTNINLNQGEQIK